MARSTRTASAPRPAASIRGGLIGIERDGILGWAADPTHPEAPVRLRLMAGAQLVAEVTADRFDDARIRTLVGAGIGGFVARLPAAPAGPYPLGLTLHDPSGAQLGEALHLRGPAELRRVIGPSPPDTYEGHIDGVFEGRLMGWARDTEDPDAVVELELRDGVAVLATTRADRLREDLRAAGLHHGLYGYAFDLPVALLDGHSHSLSVRVAGTPVALLGGPIVFGPLQATTLLNQVSALQSEVAKLRQQVDSLIGPDGSLQRKIMRVLAERLAAQAEIEHEQIGRDIDALRRMVFAAAGTGTAFLEHYGAPDKEQRRA